MIDWIWRKSTVSRNNNLVFYGRLNLKPQHVAEWRKLLAEVIENMARETAFVACYLNQKIENENHFTLYEVWNEPSVDDFLQNQMSKDYRTVYEEKLSEWLESPRSPTILRCLDQWLKL